jgi:hypothetical protein
VLWRKFSLVSDHASHGWGKAGLTRGTPRFFSRVQNFFLPLSHTPFSGREVAPALIDYRGMTAENS